FVTLPPAPRPTRFPYTTLFRSTARTRCCRTSGVAPVARPRRPSSPAPASRRRRRRQRGPGSSGSRRCLRQAGSRPPAWSCVAWVSFPFRKEDRFDGFAEQARQAEGQRQARVVLAGLDRVHGLARDLQALGQFALRPAEALAQFTDAAVHGALSGSGG